MPSQLQDGACEARTNDTKNVKENILIWLGREIAESGTLLIGTDSASKVKRGFNHPVTGRLLCPVPLNWDDPVYVSMPCFLSLTF